MEALSKMFNNKKPKKFNKDSFNANHVDSLSVIREVKKHRVMYDTEHPRYHDQTYRNEVWDQIYVALYPNFWQYNAALQIQIGVLVRRRWKSVRNYIAQEAKLMQTTDYSRKRESTQWTELQFILPYIKSPYCEKVALEMGITRLDPEDPNTEVSCSKNNGPSNENYANEGFVKFIKHEEPYEQYDEYDPDCSNDDVEDDVSPEDKCIPTTTIATSVHPIGLHCNSNHSKTSPMLTPKPSTQDQSYDQLNDIDCMETESVRKRSRTESSEDKSTSTDMQAKLIDLLKTIEHRQLKVQAEDDLNDVDRMFFMSLLSDFKQIPAPKKIAVKAKITTIIADAIG